MKLLPLRIIMLSSLVYGVGSLQAQPALDTPCSQTGAVTLADYLSMFGTDSNGAGCSVGLQNFSEFDFNSSGSATLLATPSQIAVTPAIGGFIFSQIDGSFSVPDNQTALYQISYDFNIDPRPATDASEGMDPIFGDVTIDQYYCADSTLTFSVGNIGPGTRECENANGVPFSPQDLHLAYDSPVPILTLTTGLVPLDPEVMESATTQLDISLDGTGLVGGADFDSVTGDTFLAPEPGTWLLMAAGLLAILKHRRIARVLSS